MPLDTENFYNNNLSNYFIPAADFQMMPNQITIDETIKTFEPRLRSGPIESNEKEGILFLNTSYFKKSALIPQNGSFHTSTFSITAVLF